MLVNIKTLDVEVSCNFGRNWWPKWNGRRNENFFWL